MSRAIVRLELSFKKMPIEEAIALLQRERAEGATHATLRVRWEEPAGVTLPQTGTQP